MSREKPEIKALYPRSGPLPNERLIRPGLVTAQKLEIIRQTAPPLLKGLAWRLIGQQDRGIAIYQRIYQEEYENLSQEMEESGLFGKHPLRDAKFARERESIAHGSIGGSLFGISGEFNAQSKKVSKVGFAWETDNKDIILSELNAQVIQIHPDEETEYPTVEFEFDANKLLYQPLYAKGALVRESYAHPNGYIYNALSKATFYVKEIQQLEGLLTIKPQKAVTE